VAALLGMTIVGVSRACHESMAERLARSARGVALGAHQHCIGIVGICAAIPEEQRAGDVSFGCGQLGGEYPATDIQSHCWIAERGERNRTETIFARDLSHDLHEAPGKGAGSRFGFAVANAAYLRRRDVPIVEGRLVSQGPAIPRRLLFDDRADEVRRQRVRLSGNARQCEQFERWCCGIWHVCFSRALSPCDRPLRLLHVLEPHLATAAAIHWIATGES
jgi:hypothetical protein